MKKGFTLLETLVVMAVVSVAGSLLFLILINTTGLFYLQNSKVSQGIQINDVLSIIHSNIRLATTVASGYPESSPTYTTSAEVLVLKLPAIDSSNNIILNTYDYIVYYLDVDKLRYKTFPAPSPPSFRPPTDSITASNVSQVLFQYFNSSGAEVPPSSASKIKVSISVSEKAGASNVANIATSEAFLRNN